MPILSAFETRIAVITPEIWVYIISTFLNLAIFVVVSIQKPTVYQQSIYKMMVFTSLVQIGYLFRLMSTSVDSLIFTQKLVFIGGSVIAYYYLRFVCLVYNVKLPTGLWAFFVCFAVMSVIITFTFNYHQFVYKSIEVVERENGVLKMIKEPGVFFYLYQGMYCIYFCLCLGLSIFHFLKYSNHRQRFITVCIVSVPLIVYFCSIFDNVTKLSLCPIGVLLSELDIVYIVFVMRAFDTEDVVHEEAFNGVDTGIIAFDNEGCYLGANTYALNVFDCLKKISIYDKITEDNCPILFGIVERNEKEMKTQDKCYGIKICELEKRKAKILWLTDITTKKKYEILNRKYQDRLRIDVEEKAEKIKDMQSKIMVSMSDIIENRDGNTGGHVKRTSEVVRLISKAMLEDNYPGMSQEFMDIIIRTAPMHDLGKIAVPDAILQKPGKLTDDEFSIMKSHSQKGADMVVTVLNGVESDEIIEITKNIALSHHEKYNGCGYPNGLKGESIPLEARIMAIADVYDALVCKRCYKEPMSFEQAYKIMEESFTFHFDPTLKKYFDKCRPVIESYYAADRDNNS